MGKRLFSIVTVGLTPACALIVGYWLGCVPSAGRRLGAATPTLVSTTNRPLVPARFSLPTSSDWPKFTGSVSELIARLRQIANPEERSYFLHRTILEMDPSTLPGWSAELAIHQDASDLASELSKTVVKQWSALDPTAALAWARSLTGKSQSTALSLVVCTLAEANRAAAEQIVAGLDTSIRNETLNAMALEMAGTDPRSALELLKKFPHAPDSSDEIVNAWAERDPAAAAKAIEDFQVGSPYEVYGIWGRKDPLAALAHSLQMNTADHGNELMGLFSGWAQTDAKGACEQYLALPPEEQKDVFGAQFLYFAAAKEPAAAILVLEARPSRYFYRDAAMVAASWASNDLSSAVQWVNSLSSSPRTQDEAFRQMGRKMADGDVEAILQAAQEITSTKNRTTFLQDALYRNMSEEVLSRFSPDEAAELVGARNVVGNVASLDPLAAASLLTKYAVRSDDSAWGTTAVYYAQKDLPAALAWAQSLSQDGQAATIPSVIDVLARQDPAAAYPIANQSTDPAVRARCFESLMQSWAASDPAALEAALPQFPADARGPAIKQILDAQKDPATAAQLNLNFQNEGSVQDAHVAQGQLNSLASKWADTDPKAASAWLENLPESEGKNAYTQTLTTTWATGDLTQTTQWMESLPAGNTKDQALAALANYIGTYSGSYDPRHHEEDPAQAFLWAKQIQDETMRNTAIQKSLSALLEISPDAGKQAVQTAHISDEMKATLLQSK